MNPYLSIVMGIGGTMSEDLLDRLANSVALIDGALSTELIIVEWNVSLRDFGKVEKVLAQDGISARIIHAPRELHAQVPNPHGFRYFEWYPKNIGIRRARGEFVLSTNPDDLFSDELFAYLSRRELATGCFYRVNRHDTRNGEVYRICYPTGCHAPGSSEQEIRRSLPNACPWSKDMIHYNASGDFTLMSKADWFMIHGNPEREYNHSVDGQTLYLAHLKGLKQIVLPYPIYHPDHVRTLNHAFAPEWDDNHPHTKENGEDWGFADMEFEETVL
jgi:hypothetical protein